MTRPAGVRRRCGACVLPALTALILAAPAAQTLPQVRLLVSPAHDRYREPITSAAQEGLARCLEWLGPAPFATLVVSDQPVAGAPATEALVRVDLPAWTATASMETEAQVAFGVARRWWPAQMRDADATAMADGAAWYLQSRVVEILYERRFEAPAHSADSIRLFGGFVPWGFRGLPLTAQVAGLGRGAFLASGGRAVAPRVALAFGSVERVVGWPALQGALRLWARQASERPMSRDESMALLDASLGVPFGWLYAGALDPDRVFDYAITSVESQAEADGCAGRSCLRTTVTVARTGGGVFDDLSRPQSGAFDAGWLALRASFADGQRVTSTWNGRDPSKTFAFESSAPLTEARLDPGGVVLLDRNYLDNVRRPGGATNAPVGKWVARWLVWLQDTTLSYAFLF